jgi:hypothetical protein
MCAGTVPCIPSAPHLHVRASHIHVIVCATHGGASLSNGGGRDEKYLQNEQKIFFCRRRDTHGEARTPTPMRQRTSIHAPTLSHTRTRAIHTAGAVGAGVWWIAEGYRHGPPSVSQWQTRTFYLPFDPFITWRQSGGTRPAVRPRARQIL